MSLEFNATDGNQEVISTALNVEREMSQALNIWEYLDSIHLELSQTPNGRGELGQMTRAAEFVTGRDANSHHETVYSFINGELLAQGFLKQSNIPLNSYTSLAQDHINRLEHTSLAYSSSQESEQERLLRLKQLADEAQVQLAGEIIPNFTNTAYEKFIHKAAIKFDPSSTENRSFFGMGFRLILIEHHRRFREFASDPDALNEKLDFLSEENIEPLNPIKHALNSALLDISKTYGRFDSSDFQQAQNARAAFSIMLNNFNDEKELLFRGDFISATGFYGFKSASGANSTFSSSEANSELQGFFDGLTVIEAPSDRSLRQHYDRGGKAEPKADLTIAPAIRLILPSLINHKQDGYVHSDYRPGVVIELPLIYGKSSLNRINIDQPLR